MTLRGEVNEDWLGREWGLAPLVIALVVFHVAALFAWVVLLTVGNKSMKKVQDKEH